MTQSNEDLNDPRLKFNPVTGDGDFEYDTLSNRLDAIERNAWTEGFGEGRRSIVAEAMVFTQERAADAMALAFGLTGELGEDHAREFIEAYDSTGKIED